MTRGLMAWAALAILGVGLAAAGALARWADQDVIITVVFGAFTILAVVATTTMVVRWVG